MQVEHAASPADVSLNKKEEDLFQPPELRIRPTGKWRQAKQVKKSTAEVESNRRRWWYAGVMWERRPLLLTWVLLALTVRSQSWKPCTDLLPIDLLAKALPRPGEAPPTQVQMVQSRGSRGLRLSGAVATALSFPASQIFTNCDYFPAEFSLVATFKIPRLTQKRNEYIFSVVEEEADSLLLGLRLSENRLHLLTSAPGAGRNRNRLSFNEVGLDDNRWHTVVLAVTGPYATLTVDCGLPLELKQVRSFPSTLSTRGSRLFIGSRRRWRGRFSGLLRQLVLLPGSDASPRLCPNSDPSLAELSVPQVLRSTPLQPDHNGPEYPYEAEARVTLGNPPPCSRAEQGQLWFNAQRKALFICDGLTWTTLLMKQQRLDYVEDYQDLYTSSETFDVEVFSIPSEGLFMAAANRDSRPGSGVYKWTDGSFQLYQNISTQEARAWKHFTIDEKIFLVVANSRELEPELSVIYRWNRQRRRFVRHQTLQTHAALDWEAFTMHNHSFLVVANHRRARDSNHNIHSVIYRWNPNTKLFEVNQTLSTSGAYDWEFFTVGPYNFLAVANTFDGQTTTISSTVYVWLDGRFQTFQNIPTVGATDWETFQIDGRFFLAVANSQKVSERGPSLYSINSTVYELNTLTQTFIRFQDILTHSAVDWEFFTIGDEKFLVVANSHDGSSYSLNSVVYSLPTFGCRDWEHFSTSEGSFLVYSSATSRLSKVFKLRTY
ncbi:thrombospondin-type laminin G domain and EAR repeat-containing protein-like [Scomber scombrus]|uniref:Thrombospondin-type laminin G domain and EAR repeat-containing protein-like n=1 Tax=Scomber scombrus TaxID=13677 RepID=A0AAV1PPX6_SCOSC